MGKSSSYTAGYRYFMSVHMGIARGPLDQVMEIRVGDKTAWPIAEGQGNFATWFERYRRGVHSVSGPYSDVPGFEHLPRMVSGDYYIDAYNLFGGEDGEGGVQGNLKVLSGENWQIVPQWIKDLIGTRTPDFRGVFTMFFDGLICAVNPYPKPWKMRVRRTISDWDGAVWQPDLATIWLEGNKVKAMNPAHILYEAATNRSWGRGLPRSLINEASWLAAAQRLYAEGFGMCLRWNRQDTLETFVGQVIDHIGATIYTDRQTGLLTIKLIRDDYNPEEIPLFHENNGLLSIENGETVAQERVVNEVIVKYRTPISNEDLEVRAQNLASIQSTGSLNSNTREYAGAPTHEIAARLAQRDLRASTAANRRFTVHLDRRAWRIYPGAVFRISSPKDGIDNLILRAGKIQAGRRQEGIIKIDAAIDVFGLPWSAFVDKEEPDLNTPESPSVPIYRKLREVTYRDLAERLSAIELQSVPPASGGIATLAVRESARALAYGISSRAAGETFVTRAEAPFLAAAILDGAIGPYDTSIAFRNGRDLGLIDIGRPVEIEGEIMRLVGISVNPDGTSGMIEVGRGCVDTVPSAHGNGQVIFFADAVGTDDREYALGENVEVKMLTVMPSGVLDESLAPIDQLAVTARQNRPYVPGNLRINGQLAIGASVTGDLVITWAHRDRKLQLENMVDHLAADIGPEAGTTYTLRFYSPSNALLNTFSGVTDNSFSYEDDDMVGTLRLELEAVRDGVVSHQRHNVPFTRSL